MIGGIHISPRSGYCVLNLGCKVNRVESDAMERLFEDGGLCAVPLDEAAIVVVNTCTVTGEAEKKARKLVRHALSENAHAPVIVTGCASAISPDAFERMSQRVQVVAKGDVPDALAAAMIREGDGARDTGIDGSPATDYLPDRSRIGIKIQDGCDNACTYCIVCKARGASQSVSADEVVREARRLAALGIKELMLTGIDLGAYRHIACDGTLVDLPGLLRRLLVAGLEAARDGMAPRLRISSIEPGSISRSLIELMASSDGRICRHLHIPLQSGSDRVLAQMDRHYTAREYTHLIERIRRAMPTIAITTDIIVGFPGETEGDFRRTLDVARECGFSNIHVFPYSRREGTVAAARTDQVDPSVKSARAAQLRQLALELRDRDAHARQGTIELYCVQEDGRMMSESYYEAAVPQGAREGALIESEFIMPKPLCA